MSSSGAARGSRRVVVGVDGDGRSTVTADGVSEVSTVRPNGAFLQELWRQETLPARAGDDGTRRGGWQALPPLHGVSVRIFTLAGTDQPDVPTPVPEGLHRADNLHVITVVSGQAILVLERGEVLMGQGESVVMPGSMHDWRNPFAEPAVMVTTVFCLVENELHEG